MTTKKPARSKTAKPKTRAKTKAKTTRKAKPAPTVIMETAEGLDAETVTEQPSGPGGRPTDYKPEYARIARVMCKNGATDAELAEAFDVTTVTIWRWRAQHDEFCNALKVDKDEFDDRVERSLAQRAVGYSFTSEKIFNYQGQVVRAQTTEHVPPDPGAAKLWLCNRRRDKWADTSKHELTGKNGEKLFEADIRSTAMAVVEMLREVGFNPAAQALPALLSELQPEHKASEAESEPTYRYDPEKDELVEVDD